MPNIREIIRPAWTCLVRRRAAEAALVRSL